MPISTDIQNKVLKIAANKSVNEQTKLAVRKQFYVLKQEEVDFDIKIAEFSTILDNLLNTADEVEMEQVLINLLNNAIFAAKKSEEKWVKVNAFQKDGFLHVQVTDSGPPISSEVIDKLFQPFFTTKPVGEGTGLGLSISKAIIDQHHGTLEFLPSSKHTCFEIRLREESQNSPPN